MRIAFDAKRAFQNTTGLGNYSRSLIEALNEYYPDNNFFLAAPEHTNMFDTSRLRNTSVIEPTGVWRNFKSIWRSKHVVKELKNLKIEIYHGLSNEIPYGIQYSGIKSLVSIHDLIFEKYPKQYNPIDVAIYRRKFKNASVNADKIIAMSKQTKEDLIKLYNIASDKIEVCYQSCNKIFEQTVADENKTKILKKYNLPANYLLYVGSIIERKNLLNICKALKNISTNNPIPLVVIGTGHGSYYSSVKQFVAENNLQNLVIFLSENEIAKNDIDFKSAVDFPAIYQSASALIYPSIYEGFGIPILEALWSNLPVITSNISCLPETGGDAAYYIDPFSVDDITNAILNVVSDSTLRQSMIEKGKRHTTNFTPQKCAETVMNVYHSLMR